MIKKNRPLLGRRTFGLIALAAGATLAFSPAGAADTDLGVLVTARGGGDDWNRAVEDALAPLGRDYPLAFAYGMADAAALQRSVSALEAKGVRRIVVVRLLVSGESWLERTEQALGLLPGAPEKPDDAGAGGESARNEAFWRIDTAAAFAISPEGLMDAPEMDDVLIRRARSLSRDPARESVLILAHGPADDAENARWLDKLGARAAAMRDALPFRAVLVETLREDWPEKREAAEARARAFVENASRDGGRALVIPFRVQGFGPYAETLEGLNYAADGEGLLPGPEVERWARRQVEELAAGDFRPPAP